MKIKFFNYAKKFSNFGEHSKAQVGSVIVQGNKIISWGYNQNKTHSQAPHSYKFIHAEFDSIRKLTPEQLKGSIIYVYRETKNGDLGMSKPCPSCKKLIEDVGIKGIAYSTESGYVYERL